MRTDTDLADGVLHLRGDGAHPDQLVEPELLAGQAGLRRASGTLSPAGRIASCASWAFLTLLA